ncbi:hypothetical protein ACOQFV_31860 [Nocardiopsis changdeensis]|uniref:Lipoprotein n=1 Tax=Nocardiopsis changdeensis TaxID=2831969 RepID=A0ABX8BDT2_9ACTN|nr:MULTISPECIES: hypothetical protein [Nocardiopsis]QUX20184.1 hypothetical protein KGD84_16690 [Nocardiopsis changdeensis]QYX36112.1 hypothetical protein K1J57_26145 [Nocardiopsis sp. MT53]
MRALPPGVALLAPLLALTACSSPDPLPEGTPFGEPVAVPYPFGVEGDTDPGDTVDVLYTVDDVVVTADTGDGRRVEFVVTVEDPGLGRPFDLSSLTASCEVDGRPYEGRSETPLPTVEGGTHDFTMGCTVPGGTEALRIIVQRDRAEAGFAGPIDLLPT